MRRRTRGRPVPAAMLLFLVLGVGGFFGIELALGQAGDLLGQARVRDGDTTGSSGDAMWTGRTSRPR